MLYATSAHNWRVPLRRFDLMKKSTLYLISVLLSGAALVESGCSRAKPIGLSLLGYNYTDRNIASYSVEDSKGRGTWGGSVYLSTASSGGSGATCCVMLNKDEKKPTLINVDWTFDEIDDKAGNVITPEVTKHGVVSIAPPYPKDPNNLEIHFYPDGHIEAAVTQNYSAPRVVRPAATQ